MNYEGVNPEAVNQTNDDMVRYINQLENALSKAVDFIDGLYDLTEACKICRWYVEGNDTCSYHGNCRDAIRKSLMEEE